MLNKSLFLFIVLGLAMPLLAEETRTPTWLERHGLKQEWKKPDFEQVIYDGSGRERKEKRGEYTRPRLVADTVTFSGRYATLALNETRGRSLLRLTPSSSDKIYVRGIIPIIEDSTQSPPSYGWWINRELNRITIQSSDTNDTRKVQVSYMVQ